ALDALIERQHYRLAFWKAGAHETNYRRFFAIDSLIGVRIELPEVFNECHALVGRLLRHRLITGLRIDHIDGLRDPAGYLRQVQGLAADGAGQGVRGKGQGLYVVVEKILQQGERMPAEWAAHGSTGYEFIAQVAGLMIDRKAEADFTGIYGD